MSLNKQFANPMLGGTGAELDDNLLAGEDDDAAPGGDDGGGMVSETVRSVLVEQPTHTPTIDNVLERAVQSSL